MTDLFTQDELADALQVDTGEVNPNFYARVLANVTGKIEGLIGHPLAVVEDDVAEVDAGGRPVLQLPHWPVTAISSVVIGTWTLTSTDFSFDRRGHMRRRSHHPCFPPGRHRDWGWAQIAVTYTHGYAEIPAPIKEVALDLAVAGYANPRGYRSESLATYAYSFATANGKGAVTDYHQQILADYR